MEEFSGLGLSQPVMDAIEELGFTHPTPIQKQAIPRLLQDDTDFVGLAQTGTGKTAAFGLPLVNLVDADENFTQALVLAPTRELGLQIANELSQFGKFLRKLRILAVYGGTDIGRQIRELKKGVHIIVATPGRLRDLIRRKAVDIRNIEYVVLDEADEMLNMGFKEEIDEILAQTPEDKLTWLFSATMPSEVRRISRSYMTDPLEMRVGEKNTANEDIDHQFALVRSTDKYEALRRFLDFDEETFGLVFCRTRRDTQQLAEQLDRDGYKADALHGDLNQIQRDRVMARFRSRRIKILVATDVAARGIDVNDITHVFHYNIPEDINFYTHRSGRTGRAGNKGISLILGHPRDMNIIYRIEKRLKVKFNRAKIPTGKEICKSHLLNHFQKLKEIPENEAAESFLPEVLETLDGLSREELVQKMIATAFNNSMRFYWNATDLNQKESTRKPSGKSKRLFINIGRMDIDGKSNFLSYVCQAARIPGSAIGKIDMHQKFSFFEMDDGFVKQVVESLHRSSYRGRPVRVNYDEEGGGRTRKPRSGKRHRKGHRPV